MILLREIQNSLRKFSGTQYKNLDMFTRVRSSIFTWSRWIVLDPLTCAR